MDIPQSIDWLYAASGFGIGLLTGMTGVGGGSLMTPLLVLVFGVPPVTAVGTDLIYASVTTAGGSLVHSFNRTVHWKLVGRLATGSVPAAIATLVALYFLRMSGGSANALVTKLLSVALLLIAASFIFRGWLITVYTRRVGTLSHRTTVRLTVLAGAILGILVSLTSVGAGALGFTALILLYPELPVRRIVGSDIAHAVPLTLVAGAGHWLQGTIDAKLLTSLLVGSLPGIFLGSFFVLRLSEQAIRLVLAAVLTLLAGRFLL